MRQNIALSAAVAALALLPATSAADAAVIGSVGGGEGTP